MKLKSRYIMQAVEKTHRIDIVIYGQGVDKIKKVLKKNFPNMEFDKNDNDKTDIRETDFYRQLKIDETPGLILKAYRERAGLSLTQLARKLNMPYTNLSAMEHDSRVIGLKIAKRLAKELKCNYTEFLE